MVDVIVELILIPDGILPPGHDATQCSNFVLDFSISKYIDLTVDRLWMPVGDNYSKGLLLFRRQGVPLVNGLKYAEENKCGDKIGVHN